MKPEYLENAATERVRMQFHSKERSFTGGKGFRVGVCRSSLLSGLPERLLLGQDGAPRYGV